MLDIAHSRPPTAAPARLLIGARWCCQLPPRLVWMVVGGLLLVVVWFGSVDALPYLGPRLPVVAVGDEMVDRSLRWSDCGRSVFGGPPRWAWVPGSLLELAARVALIGDGWAWSERLREEVVSGGSSAAGPSTRRRWYERRASLRAIVIDARLCDRPRFFSAW